MYFVASYSLLDESQKMQEGAYLIRSNMDKLVLVDLCSFQP